MCNAKENQRFIEILASMLLQIYRFHEQLRTVVLPILCGTSNVETERRIRIFENFSSFLTD